MTDLSNKYLAFVLDVESRNELLVAFPPVNERIICHHVTIEYDKVTPEMVSLFSDQYLYVTVTGEKWDDGVQCLPVIINCMESRPDGGLYHIMQSLAPGKKAEESNRVMVKGSSIYIAGGIVIRGTVQLLDKFVPKPEVKKVDYEQELVKFIKGYTPTVDKFELETLVDFVKFLKSGNIP